MTQLEYWKNMDGKPIPVDQNGKHAIFVGKLIVDFK
jgi:5'-nucleotidase